MIYTVVSGGFGLIFYYIFGKMLGISWLGIGLALLFAGMGFVVGTFKIPDSDGIKLTRNLGGEEIDKAFLRWWKFKKKGNVIYTYVDAEDK